MVDEGLSEALNQGPVALGQRKSFLCVVPDRIWLLREVFFGIMPPDDVGPVEFRDSIVPDNFRLVLWFGRDGLFR